MDDPQVNAALIDILSGVGWATVTLLAIVSPAIIAIITKPAWSKYVKLLTAMAITAIIGVISFALDGKLTLPLPNSFWLILIAAFGGQQLTKTVLSKQLATLQAATTPSSDFTEQFVLALDDDPLAHAWTLDQKMDYIRLYMLTNPDAPNVTDMKLFAYRYYAKDGRFQPQPQQQQKMYIGVAPTSAVQATNAAFERLNGGVAALAQPPKSVSIPFTYARDTPREQVISDVISALNHRDDQLIVHAALRMKTEPAPVPKRRARIYDA